MTALLVPVKRFDDAKSRLAIALPPATRRRLARALTEHVLTVAAQALGASAVYVLTADEEAGALAVALGARVLPDAQEAGQNAAVARGFSALRELGHERMITVPADLPLLQPSDLAAAAALLQEDPDRVVLAPAARGGTNLLGVAGRVPPALAFGDDSFRRFQELCRQAAIPTVTLSRPGLYQDMDEPEDLAPVLASPDCGAELREILAGPAPVTGTVQRPLIFPPS